MTLSKWRHWLENHLRAFLFGMGELIRAPIASLMTLLVIGIAMAFPAGLYALLDNVQQFAKQWHNDPSISLYLKSHLNDSQISTLINQLQNRGDIARVEYISPQQGLAQFRQQSDLNSALELLAQNPLPGIIVVTPRIDLRSTDVLPNLLSSLNRLPNVETSQLDTIWVKRLYELMTLGERITYGLMILFGIGVALIVGNTMRMATQSHRQEIIVLKLVGATKAFIRRPMLYRGALYGVLGGMIAWLLVSILFWWLRAPAQRLADSYHGHWHLQGLNNLTALIIITACALLGLIGSWLSVQHFLQAPEEI